jgi:hypothetical protein
MRLVQLEEPEIRSVVCCIEIRLWVGMDWRERLDLDHTRLPSGEITGCRKSTVSRGPEQRGPERVRRRTQPQPGCTQLLLSDPGHDLMKEDPAIRADRRRFHEIGRIGMDWIDPAEPGLQGSTFPGQNRQASIVIPSVLPLARVDDPASMRQPGRSAVVAHVEGEPPGKE